MATTSTRPAGMFVDPRGPRTGAILTTVVLAAVLLLPDVPAAVLLGLQTMVFATGLVFGLSRAPYGYLFRAFVRPRLGPPAELEAEAPPRFAQGVGAAFGLIGTIGYATGLTPLGLVATGFALAAAFLNAAFGLCLGCEMHLLLRRALSRPQGPRFIANPAH